MKFLIMAFLVLLVATNSFAEPFSALPGEDQRRFHNFLNSFQMEIQNIPPSQQLSFALSKLGSQDYYKLFIDKKDHDKLPDPHNVYEVNEPGYYKAMISAFEYLKSIIQQQVSLDEMIALHDLAVHNVNRANPTISEHREFKKGIAPGYCYGLHADPTYEARLDWKKYKLIYERFLSSEEVFWPERKPFIQILEKQSKSEKVRIIKSLTKEKQSSFRCSLINTCYREQIKRLTSECYAEGSNMEYLILAAQSWLPFLQDSLPTTLNQKLDPVTNLWYHGSFESIFEDECANKQYVAFLANEWVKKRYIQTEFLATRDGQKITSNLEKLLQLKSDSSIEVKEAVKKRLEPVFALYFNSIRTSKSNDERLGAISIFLRSITIFHIFPDGNLRTVLLLLNKLLVQNGLPTAILDDPNVFGGYYGTSEMIGEIKKGMFNFMEAAQDFKYDRVIYDSFQTVIE